MSFLLLHRAPRWSLRAQAVLTVLLAITGMAVHAYAANAEAWALWLMFVDGPYPLLTWTAYMLIGFIAGQTLLNNERTQIIALIVGFATVVFGVIARGNETLATSGFLDPSPHSGGAIDFLATSSSSIATIAACLVLTRSKPLALALAPLQAFGSMSLTMYILHVLSAGTMLNQPSQPVLPNAALTSIFVGLAFAMAWKLTGLRRGPAEWLMHRLATLGRPKSPASLATAALTLLPTPAYALDNATPTTDPQALETVARIYFNESPADEPDCTGTMVADRWAITARHCIDGLSDTSGILTLGNDGSESDYEFDGAVPAPHGDFALLHTTEPINTSGYPQLSDDVPSQGSGTTYGWSSSGMGGEGTLPQAEFTIDEVADFSLYDGDSTLLTTLKNNATSQPGDSGGPLFVDGKIAGVASVALGGGNEESSNSVAYSPVASQAEWARELISNDEVDSALFASADGADAITDVPWWYALIAFAVMVIVAVPFYRKRG
ncbi:trypsin-like serine protease [Corynebacterium breve]|uniref:trypsin n=1 Tax=Corynebacterium breve TaxID=3049799 RepID=A0ABY8VF06_9CORY|nr:trypsin-like serine protease [Corynebacterium breve]WIM68235.1 trypsin-like serine protease [Corynebacterium breve]